MSDRAQEADYFDDDVVDEAGRESFPASDPPSFSPGISSPPAGSVHPAGAIPPLGANPPIGAGRAQRGGGLWEPNTSRNGSPIGAALGRCCNVDSVAPWGLFLAATVAGFAVGGLLAQSYLGRR